MGPARPTVYDLSSALRRMVKARGDDSFEMDDGGLKTVRHAVQRAAHGSGRMSGGRWGLDRSVSRPYHGVKAQ
jgi:hypothetical protein